MDNFMAMANSGMLYLIAGVVIAFVMILAAVFLVKAYREGVKIGMDKKKMHTEPIKTLGVHNVEVRVHPKVTATLKVKVKEDK